MVYTTIAPSRNITRLMRYLRDEKAHDGQGDRYVGYKAQNVSIHSAERSMLASLYRHGKSSNVHATAVVTSFHEDELNPRSSEDIQKALEIAHGVAFRMVFDNERERLDHVEDEFQRQELAKAEADKYKIISIAQNDGEGGKLHVHTAILNINPETGRSLNGKSRYHSFVKKAVSLEMERQNVHEFDYSQIKDKSTKWEKQRRSAGEYVWRDDLKNRIQTALKRPEIVSDDVFALELGKVGVNVQKRGKGYSFAFTDDDGKQRKARGGKLGPDFELNSVQQMFQNNLFIQKQREDEEKAKAEKLRLSSSVQSSSLFEISLDDLGLDDVQKPQKAPESILRVREGNYTRQTQKSRVGALRASDDVVGIEHEKTKSFYDVLEKENPPAHAGGRDVLGSEDGTAHAVTDGSPAGLNRGDGRDEVRHDLLNYIHETKFRLFSPNGKAIVSLEPMTFKERMEKALKREMTDDELIEYATKWQYRPAKFNALHNKYFPVERIGNSNPNTTLFEQFSKSKEQDAKTRQNLDQFLKNVQEHTMKPQNQPQQVGPDLG